MSSAVHGSAAGGVAWPALPSRAVWERRLLIAAAMAFVNQVGEMAEGANHHPDILIHGRNKVRLTLSTDSEGKVTQADHDLAAGIDGLGVG